MGPWRLGNPHACVWWGWRRGKTIVSNATRWDTFESMMGSVALPLSEVAFRKRYQKSPSFLSIHMGVKAELLPEVRDPPTSCSPLWGPRPGARMESQQFPCRHAQHLRTCAEGPDLTWSVFMESIHGGGVPGRAYCTPDPCI